MIDPIDLVARGNTFLRHRTAPPPEEVPIGPVPRGRAPVGVHIARVSVFRGDLVACGLAYAYHRGRIFPPVAMRETANGARDGKPVKRSVLGPGTKAPEFRLNSTPDQKLGLRDFRGRPVILAFYPADWSPVCSDQLSLLNQVLPEFRKYHDAELIAISVDGIWSHIAFAKDRKLKFPVLADFEPKGKVARLYGAYQEAVGESARALFVIDAKGVIRWSYLSPVGVNPGVDGILGALDEMYPRAAAGQARSP